MKTEVKRLKDTLSCNQEKLETLPTKYNNTKESLKGAKSEHAKAKDRVAKLEKSVADLKKVAKEMLQVAKFEEHLGQAVDAVVGNIISLCS